jgi:phenylpropionate dioxygenase-like ring-hydroxylating dioxygenase large terminal subunit
MLNKEQNDLLTQTGPGTPGGNLFRQYWLPVALAEQVPQGGAPLELRILSEDLVLFRDQTGELGLMGLYCPHRCTNLSYGRIEDGGLRCLYHGWLFDRKGNCIEQPAEPANSTYKDEVKHTAYAAREKAGVIFAYMGAGEPPDFPEYEFLEIDESHRSIYKVQLDCNYFQACEGDFDPSHVSYLHRRIDPKAVTKAIPGGKEGMDSGSYFAANTRPQLSFEKTDYGVRIFSERGMGPGEKYLRVTNFLLPSLACIAGRQAGDGYSAVWRVPIDDTTHWRFGFQFQRSAPLDRKLYDEQNKSEITPDFKAVRHQGNRYLQDRATMTQGNFTGMGNLFMVHDAFAAETQGVILDRSKEHLGTGDVVIAGVRRLMRLAMDGVAKGELPPNVTRGAQDKTYPNLIIVNAVVDAKIENSDYVKGLFGKDRFNARSAAE